MSLKPVPDELRGEVDQGEFAQFDMALRRNMEDRIRYAFIRTDRPSIDDRGPKSFDTTAAYRAWCEENIHSWLGYGRYQGKIPV